MNRLNYFLCLIALFIFNGVKAQVEQADTLTTDTIEAKYFWEDIEIEHPWVTNVSRPETFEKGLEGRHIALWASHGRYYDADKGYWKWQRPNLFGTTEDLYTQTIVIPYLIPMLEKAGAIVFTPRERDWQTEEYIVDNDDKGSNAFFEINQGDNWHTSNVKGFKNISIIKVDSLNPFTLGTARFAYTTKHKQTAQTFFQPTFKEPGKYAVYVSYQTLEGAIPDAEYIVRHRGMVTTFRVNQQMGAGTWVYLGTFEFDEGSNMDNCVVLTNDSKHVGVVSADAVRFGGGMGNIVRGGRISHLPRCLEGARYYAQWAGAPYEVYSRSQGTSDYKDDINVRSLMSNWLGGGSPYMPTLEGKHVPIELSVAIHSDAGYEEDGKTLKGSLGVCTTDYNNGLLNYTLSRKTSKDFIERMLWQVTEDMTRAIGKWNVRGLWDKNYSETRLPEVPSIIFETLSHQSFPDMIIGQDPNFKFLLARSIYKTILHQVSKLHKTEYVITPLAPTHFSAEIVDDNKVELSWKEQKDTIASSTAKAFIVYTAEGDKDFDNGQRVKGHHLTIDIAPDRLYRFKVSATNDGGESFTSPTLAVYLAPNATKNIMLVDAFHRLAAPEILDNDSLQGFCFDKDFGVAYGLTNEWNGKQLVFTKTTMGKESSDGLGYGNEEWKGKYWLGNNFDCVVGHAQAIAQNRQYNIVSCERECIEDNLVKLKDYDCIDLIFGLEKYQPHTLVKYKTFTPQMKQQIKRYCKDGGSLLVSGSYIGSDMQAPSDSIFLREMLKCEYTPDTLSRNNNNEIVGLGMEFKFCNTASKKYYAVNHPETLNPTGNAFCAMAYKIGGSAAVAYDGTDYKAFTMGFPLESINDNHTKTQIFAGILKFLIK